MSKGGYYIKARKIDGSEIAHWPPHVREIWDWLLRKAYWKDNGKIKRGQLVLTTKDIQEGLHWKVGWRKEMYSKTLCENSMKILRKAEMVTTQRTGRGVIVTITNYEQYQDPNNYDSRDESRKGSRTETEQKPNHREESTKEGKKEGEGVVRVSAREADKKKRDSKITAGQFEEFWKLYPGKKINRGGCLTKWKTICGWKGETPPTWGEIRSAIAQQKKTHQWAVKGFIPHPHTWLNQRKWLDDPKEMGDFNYDDKKTSRNGAKKPEGHFDHIPSRTIQL